jgi:hypothetical protein
MDLLHAISNKQHDLVRCSIWWEWLFSSFVAARFNLSNHVQVTDRCCSAALLAVLAHLYTGPKAFGFLLLLALDLASHYCHVYSQVFAWHSDDTK